MKVKIKPMTPGVPRSARVRAYAASVVVTLGLGGAAMKAWALQVDDGDHYRALAERQHAMRLDIPAPRGEVVDAQGRPLAISADADSIWANPREVRDVTGTAEKLAKLIDGDAGMLEAKLGGDRRFVWIDRHVTPDVAKAVRDAKIRGIEVASEPRRWYPAKSVAGPVIGRADIDGNGLDGIELGMNDLLMGKRGTARALRDAHGRKMLAADLAPAEAGASVKLTLDRSIQAVADEALAEAVTKRKAKNGVVVVLDVATSKVLAMSSFPTFDPNGGNVHGARNRAVTDAYEAGSVLKVFTIAAALEDGAVKPTTGFVTGNGLKVRGRPRPITDTHPEPYLTVTDIMKVSSNIGATRIALRLGSEKVYSYFKQFGFGAETGIELPGEVGGKMRPGSTWRESELATMAFGYGLTVTPLQIAAALAAIGNRGVYRAPRIVEEVVDGDGTVVYRGSAEPRQMMSTKHADEVVAMLAAVFEKGNGPGTLSGTAANIDVPGFRCGGKTGTAHKYDPALKSYSLNRYLSSFIGLAPIDNPRLAIVVMIDEVPRDGDYYGGLVAGPVFAKVASESLRYLGVPGEKIIPRDARGKPIPLDANGKPLPQDRWGNYIQPKPPKKPAVVVEEPALEVEPVPEPEPDPAAIMIPDFRGMGVGRALDEARKLHLEVEVVGSGQVVEQDPAPGPTLQAERIKLRFSDDTRRISVR
jgi:cell division protein FtsI (penicillin-binding protein 3)